MSRVFTLILTHKGCDCSVLVSLKGFSEERQVHVRFFDKDFHIFFPGGLVYNGKDGYKKLTQHHHEGARELTYAVGMAIEQFLTDHVRVDSVS
jgi:hypothetical protein